MGRGGTTRSGAVDLDALGAPMGAGNLALEPMAEEHRKALKAACAEDRDIWSIYATSYDPDHFDAAFDLIRSRPGWRCFSILLDGEVVGMSCFIGIDAGAGRSRSATPITCRSCAAPASTAGSRT